MNDMSSKCSNKDLSTRHSKFYSKIENLLMKYKISFLSMRLVKTIFLEILANYSYIHHFCDYVSRI